MNVLNLDETREENGVLILTEVEDVSDLLHGQENSLLLVAIYSPTCPFSAILLKKMEKAAALLSGYFGSLDDGPLRGYAPRVAKLDGTEVEPSLMQTLGIDAYPSLLFFRQVKDVTTVREYMGLMEESAHIFETIMHYWYRYTFGPVLILDDLLQLQAFILKHGAGLLRHVTPPLNPDYTDSEKEIITWLMNSEDDQPDHYTLFIECHASPSQSLHDLADIVETQRDVALFSLADCEALPLVSEGEVVLTQVNPHSWQLSGVTLKPPEISLHEFAVLHTTPSVIFYDRVSTGPIAFAAYRKIHAVLFTRLAHDQASHSAIRSFRQACQETRNNRSDDIVCMVVPETETRILTNFGIDIWTPLDQKLSHGTKVSEVLPVLLITDQRRQQFRRYFLDASEILQDVSRIPKFFADFWNNQLTPERKSSSRPAHKNSHGVEIISGNDFVEIVLERQDKHTLLYLHSPTCGHCKRFSSVWNELGRMVKAVQWDAFLDLVQMDTTENEILELDIDPSFLPALYYLPSPNKRDFVQFDMQDKFGESVGRLRDPTEILDWMLSQGGFDETKLLALIGDVEG